MHNEAAVAEEGSDALDGRCVQLSVGSLVGIPIDLAMLACQISNLAGLGEVSIAGRVLSADVGIQMSQRLGAVSVTGNGIHVDVVC